LLENYDDEIAINVGTGKDISIRDLAELIKQIVGFEGEIQWDSSRPDGTPRKLLDVSRLTELGWRSSLGLDRGIAETYKWFRESAAKA
jgi:GDP-L-fucose synthase